MSFKTGKIKNPNISTDRPFLSKFSFYHHIVALSISFILICNMSMGVIKIEMKKHVENYCGTGSLAIDPAHLPPEDFLFCDFLEMLLASV